MRAQGMQMAIASHVGSGIMELPLEMGAIADGKRVRDALAVWGLIIGLRRGESEIVPRGDTRLRAGDYLVVLFSGEGGARGATCDAGGCVMPGLTEPG